MSMYFFGAFYSIIFVILCKMFIEIFEVKRVNKIKIPPSILILSLILIIYSITVIFANNFLLKQLFVLFCSSIFMWLYFKQSFFKILVFVLLYQGAGLVIDYTTIILISKCFPVVTLTNLSEPMINIFMGALSQTLLLCFIFFLKKIFHNKSSDLFTSIEWIRFSIFPIFTIMVIISLLTGFEIPLNNNQKNILICIAFGLIVMNIVVFYLINDILKRELQIRNNKILIERVRSEKENYDKLRKREHEHKNHISFITALAKDNKYQELNEYLNEYNKSYIQQMDLIDTNNTTINAILNLKYQEAKNKGIVFVIKINDLSDLNIKDDDLVIILSNLLNNAIEASEKSNKPTIKLKFIKEQKQIIISVINTISVEPVTDNSNYITTKTTSPHLHGIGIDNIKESVSKYGGTCVIKHDKLNFQFTILIPH